MLWLQTYYTSELIAWQRISVEVDCLYKEGVVSSSDQVLNIKVLNGRVGLTIVNLSLITC